MSADVDYYPLVNTGDSTGWIDCQPTTVDFGFHAVVTGTVTYIAEVASDPSSSKVDAYTAETFSTSLAKQYEYPMPRFIRFRKTAGSGSVTVSIWPGRNGEGKKVSLRPQSSSNSPSGAFS